MRVARDLGFAAVATQRGRLGSTCRALGLGRAHQRQHRLAMAARGCHPPLAAPLLDLSTRSAFLRADEFVISTDEKTGIQARLRIHPSLPGAPAKSMRVEHEYARGGAWAYLAALDVHRAKVFGRCEATTGIAPFERLVDQVMNQAPYDTARRVFWVMDNGSSHRGQASVRRLTQAHPRLVPVHGPGPRELAQPDRNLLLNRATQGVDAERLPQLGGSSRTADKLRALLREHRAAIRVEVHPRRPQCLDRAHT
jgi:DDE superfamily endonuclease